MSSSLSLDYLLTSESLQQLLDDGYYCLSRQETVERYVNAHRNARSLAGASMMYRTAAIMQQSDAAPELFSMLVGFMLDYIDGTSSAVRSYRMWVDPPTEYALDNPACPADILSRACHSKNLNYVRLAAQNPSCPSEDAVYGTLRLAE